jgi:hypothetical protein
VDNQEDYPIPTTALDIMRVEVLDNAGNYVLLREIKKTDVNESMPEFYETKGMPIYFYREANSLILKPAPSSDLTTLTAGLQLYLAREVTDFGITATSTEPSFPVAFHRVISIGPAIDFARANIPDHLTPLYAEYGEMKKDFMEYYSKRSRKNRAKINRRRLDTI